MESERKQSVAVGRRLAVVAVDDSETSLKLANYAANELPAEYEVQLLHVQPSYYEDAHVYNDPTEVPGDPQLSAPKTPVEIAASFVTTRLLPIVKARHTDAEEALQIAEYVAAELPKRYEVHLLNVQPAGYEDVTSDEDSETRKYFRKRDAADLEHSFVAKALALVKARHPDARVVTLRVRLLAATPRNIGDAICDYVHEKHASLLLVMAGKRRDVTKLLVGSTTDYCVTHCSCPLLLLPHE
ncbi:hypothetical protein WJX72_000247 [[Myrmecia] bisecta]|uniref:UspA domain-containing protein n=1 Tax=[Myrmecia] bisecta TaxID=41462 RepID=A0AAW1R4Y8_9CHLO